jgi:transposase-like protein
VVAGSESDATDQERFHWLLARGLRGVVLVTSDDHAGLRAAIRSLITRPAPASPAPPG